MKKNKIWLVNYYAMPPDLESRLRTIKFAHYLGKSGYDVKIISSSYLHNTDKNLIDDNSNYIFKKYDDLNFIHIRTKKYKGNGISRIISLFQFHIKLFLLRKKFEKPDYIIHTVLPPFGNITYYTAKKLNATYITEVLDLWPDSLVDLGVINKKSLLLPILYKFEKWIYEKSDAVIFSMEGGKDYILDKKWNIGRKNIDLNKIFYINNGVDIEDFNYNNTKYILSDNDLENKEIKKIIYIGSIRLANNLMELIKAAEIINSKRNDIKFLLFGDGADRILLEDYCTKNKIENIIFKEKWILPIYVPYVLSKANVNILNYNENFGKYGGSQSKLFQYIASGNPICSNLRMMYCLVNKHNLGIAKKFHTPLEYSEAIEQLADLNNDTLNTIKVNSNNIIEEFDYKYLTNKLIEVLNEANIKKNILSFENGDQKS